MGSVSALFGVVNGASVDARISVLLDVIDLTLGVTANALVGVEAIAPVEIVLFGDEIVVIIGVVVMFARGKLEQRLKITLLFPPFHIQ